MSRFNALTLLPLLTLLSAPLRADVIVVDPHGGPGAALLQSALDAAQDGDILVLHAGDYASPAAFEIAGKSLTLVAEPSGSVTLPGLHASGSQGSSPLVLRGLRLAGTPALDAPAGSLHAGAGVLWIEDCTALGRAGWIGEAGGLHAAQSGLELGGFRLIEIARTTVVGGSGPDAQPSAGLGAFPGATAMAIFGNTPASLVTLDDVEVTGGPGGHGPADWTGAGGGTGMTLFLEAVLVDGSTIVGGELGDSGTGASGAGLDLTASAAALRGSTIAAGDAHGGAEMPAIIGVTYTKVDYLEAPRRLALPSPVHEFGPANVHVDGESGDLAWIFLTQAPKGLWAPGKQGAWTVASTQPVLPVLLGATDGAGQLDVQTTMPALPSGTDGVVLFAQLAVVHGGKVLLGTSSSLVWVSASN